ncbi:glycosyltransferase family protein [Salinicola halophyticus]|uniref:hypothetical protein n=1 Tax=Salinicola halophyticus TaxID=1808881 RepID=UPI003F467915
MREITVLGLHYRNTKNIGDRNCHALDYVTFDSDQATFRVIKADVRELPAELPPGIEAPDIVVFGGGAIADHAPRVAQAYPEALKIAWGLGYTTGKRAALPVGTHQRFRKDFDLYGVRDIGVDESYTPCPSCLSDLFDAEYPITHDVVVYGHAGKWPLKEDARLHGYPYLDNTDHKQGLKGVIEHLASGETIVTSSYHGAFWASLLGRKVCMLPFGSKFYHLKHLPTEAASFAEAVAVASQMEASILSDYRLDTLTFQRAVCRLVEQRLGVPNVTLKTLSPQDIM